MSLSLLLSNDSNEKRARLFFIHYTYYQRRLLKCRIFTLLIKIIILIFKAIIINDNLGSLKSSKQILFKNIKTVAYIIGFLLHCVVLCELSHNFVFDDDVNLCYYFNNGRRTHQNYKIIYYQSFGCIDI